MLIYSIVIYKFETTILRHYSNINKLRYYYIMMLYIYTININKTLNPYFHIKTYFY